MNQNDLYQNNLPNTKNPGDYTTKIDQIKRMENIPENTLVTATYDFVTDTTVCACLYDQKVEKSIEE